MRSGDEDNGAVERVGQEVLVTVLGREVLELNGGVPAVPDLAEPQVVLSLLPRRGQLDGAGERGGAAQ